MRKHLKYWREELRWWFSELVDFWAGAIKDRQFVCLMLLSVASFWISLLSIYMSAMKWR